MEMKHYENPSDEQIYAYPADGSYDAHIPSEYILLSDEEAQIKIKQINDKWYNDLSYTNKRQENYPPFEDYLDAIVKNDAAQLQKYIDDCLAVKAKFPKS